MRQNVGILVTKDMNLKDILEQVRYAIDVMRKYKEDNRLISDIKACVAEDVFDKLVLAHAMTRDTFGGYSLEGVPVFELKDYPKGYISVE